MPSFPENSEIADNVEERKIWKIVPGFLRKKPRNVKQNPPEYQEVTADNTNKAAFEEADLFISENDDESEIVTDTSFKGGEQKIEDDHRLQQSLVGKRSLANRLSWTYGYKTSDRNHSMQRKKGMDLVDPEPNLEFPVLQLEDEDQPSSIRPLQRGESFPGKLAAGTLSKHEAKRRLMSWRRTTIVRKNSEHQ